MNILEQAYEINFNKINFLERKVSITDKYTILLGAPKSGKSYLIYDYLSNFDEDKYIYIDFDDCKNIKNDIEKDLETFIIKNKIEVLVLENFKFDIKLPIVSSIIITTKILNKLDGYETIYLQPLDFEEFLLFDTKHQNISYSFNSFLKFGNLPEIIEYSEQKKQHRNYEICKLYCADKTQLDILFLLIKNAAEKKSIFQLFNSLKKEIKISKDRFYKTCEEFERDNIINLCSKFEQPKAVKKIFVFNHALIDIVSYKKNFNNLFKNMIFLEINKIYDDIYYLDNIDFYIPSKQTIILAIPFFNNIISSSIISKVLPLIEIYNIKKISIVTISGEQNIFIGEIEAQILPFYNWVLAEK
ncbi:MAG: ATP-binding protein [Campylobacterota bacterium]|nr:ATP-binding protein [Campylobacterota bacterium]